jgi:hypothetical protein
METDRLIIYLIIIVGLFSTGCKKEGCTESCASNYNSKAKKDDGSCKGCTDSEAANYCSGAVIDDGSCTYDHINLSFTFSHTIGSSSVEYDTIKYTDAAGNDYSVETLKYFVSDITLHKSSGGTILIDDEHYVDARDNATLIFSPSKEIPNGTYSYITFIFGLDTNKNTTGVYPNTPESNMEWPVPMGGGYHYMKLEGRHDSSGTTKNYQAHMGPTMGNDYHVSVTLPSSSFTANGNNLNANVTMDINKWFETPNTLDLNNVSGIMGDMSMQMKLQQNGADVFTVSFQ